MNIPTPQTEDTRTKHEILLLILHHLEEEGMAQSAQTLRDEISAQRRGATPAQHFDQLRKLIANGEWNDAHALVKQITRKRNRKLFKYLLRKEEYLELLDRQESQKAFGFLTKRLKPLEQTSRRLDPKEFDDLCYLITCTSVQAVARFKYWQPQNAREKLLEMLLRKIDLDRRFDVEIEEEIIPPRRLKSLLERHVHQSLLSDRDETKTMSTLPTRLCCSYSSISTLSNHDTTIKCVSVSSRYVVAGLSNHSITFWARNKGGGTKEDSHEEEDDEEEMKQFQPTVELTGHKSRVWCVDSQTNQDSDIVVSGSSDGTVRLWRAKYISDEAVTCSHVTRFDDSDSETLSDIYAVSIQSNTEIFAAGSLSGFAHLVNVKTGKRVARLEGHTAAVTDLCFCRETSNLVVTSSNDTTVRLWDVLSGSCIQKIPHVAEITSVSSSGNYLVTSSSDNSHRIWDVRTFRFLSRLTGHENTSKKFVRAVFGTHETYLASGSQDGFVYIWDNPTEQSGSQVSASRRLGSGEDGVVYGVACYKDSLFSCGDNGVVCEWR